MRSILLVVALLMPSTATAATHLCHTPQLLPTFEPAPGPASWTAARDKYARNPLGLPNERLSDNFAVRWGNSWGGTTGQVDDLLDALEDAWRVQIGEMLHPMPWGTTEVLMNVYIGDSGNGAPPGYGAGGYFTPDDDSYPTLVIAADSIPARTRTVAIHELYHAVQWGLGTYTYDNDDPGAWYWEATASWIPSMVDTNSSDHAIFLFGFALAAYLPLDSFDYADSGALIEYHQYGAMIFPTFISEQVTPWQAVRNSWVEPVGGGGDPIEALRYELDDLDEDFDDVFVEFAAHNVFWDYRQGDDFEYLVEFYEDYYPGEDPYTAIVTEAGEGRPPGSREPYRYGTNTLHFDLPGSRTWELTIDVDGRGDRDSAARWGATLVTRSGGIDYERLPFDDGIASVRFVDDGDVALSIAAWSEDRRSGEQFGWSWDLREVDDLGDDDDATDDDDAFADDDDDFGGGGGGSARGRGCACDAASSPGPPPWLALAGLLLVRRRERSARPTTG